MNIEKCKEVEARSIRFFDYLTLSHYRFKQSLHAHNSRIVSVSDHQCYTYVCEVSSYRALQSLKLILERLRVNLKEK